MLTGDFAFLRVEEHCCFQMHCVYPYIAICNVLSSKWTIWIGLYCIVFIAQKCIDTLLKAKLQNELYMEYTVLTNSNYRLQYVK